MDVGSKTLNNVNKIVLLFSNVSKHIHINEHLEREKKTVSIQQFQIKYSRY